jgi:mRNA interferase MazF
MIKQGDIYLVDFAKKYNSEFAKIRPAVILQNNFLNRALSLSKFQSVIVIPLSTQDIITEYKIEIRPRDNLKERSFIIANWLCTLDLQRIQIDRGIITQLNDDELNKLKSKICDLF